MLSISILTLVGCSQQKLNQQTNSIGSKSTEIPITFNANSKKKIIVLKDIEKLFINQKINLVKKDVEQSDFNRLMQKYPTEYYLNGDKNQVLKIYVFNSQDERVKAKTEYNNKTAAMNMTYREIYEVKNIMVFLIAGDSKNECYQKVSTMVQGLK
ncbi:hypothetical protein [Candidatus Clostridium radicumherbarum]|uniref:Lipoprotein n=1 Tax=Candidatus Clostridium radicumherbarum TaxID=3381662 RepID=A0ABW8TUL7_9CLOT